MTAPDPTAPDKPKLPFESLPIGVQASKVKNLLTGMPLLDDESKMLAASGATALPALIDKWTATDEWRGRMLAFFKQAFQQTQTDPNDYDDMLGFTTNPINNLDKQQFLHSAEEMFARTALELIKEGKPFTEVATTERFMMNAPLMALHAWMDSAPLNDENKPVTSGFWLLPKLGGQNLTFVREVVADPATGKPVSFEESIRPGSPFYFHFNEPQPYKGINPNCKEPQDAKGAQSLRYLITYIFGGRPGCGSTQSQWSDADWNTWKWVTIRRPKTAEERTIFFELAKLRAGNELVLNTPRVGYMTTMAFFANWPTNSSNSYRVTTNQALIVGLGKSFDDRNVTVQLTEDADDDKHVKLGTTCFGCHQTLDPMRDLFRASYALSYSDQLNAMERKVMGKFAVDDGPALSGVGIATMGRAIATHPRFATAWTQKLCALANSTPCTEDDPEFLRVAGVFKAKNFNFRELTKELFSSPLVTFAKETVTAKNEGVVISISRRETLCAALSNRFGVADACGLEILPGMGGAGPAAAIRTRARNLSTAIPGAGYSRSDESPLMPHDPNLFFHAATENLCAILATQLVNNAGRYKAAQAQEALTEFVSLIMGVPASDPRSPAFLDILKQHFAEASKMGTPTDALQSAFMLACQSPLGISLGL